MTNGLFDVVLGTGTLDTSTPLNQLPPSTFTTDLWIGVKVQGDTGEMTPRQQLLPATHARNALSLNGLVHGHGRHQHRDAQFQRPDPVQSGRGRSRHGAFGPHFQLFRLHAEPAQHDLRQRALGADRGGLQRHRRPGLEHFRLWRAGPDLQPGQRRRRGVRGSASSGTGVVAQSVSGIGLSVTTQSTNPAQPSIYAAGLYPESISVATSPANGIGLSLGDGVSQSVNLLDRKDSAGLWASTTGSGILGFPPRPPPRPASSA